jgi:hypothetical protein
MTNDPLFVPELTVTGAACQVDARVATDFAGVVARCNATQPGGPIMARTKNIDGLCSIAVLTAAPDRRVLSPCALRPLANGGHGDPFAHIDWAPVPKEKGAPSPTQPIVSIYTRLFTGINGTTQRSTITFVTICSDVNQHRADIGLLINNVEYQRCNSSEQVKRNVVITRLCEPLTYQEPVAMVCVTGNRNDATPTWACETMWLPAPGNTEWISETVPWVATESENHGHDVVTRDHLECRRLSWKRQY